MIVTTDIKNYLSGGASNSNVNASLGGVISSVEVVDNTLNNLFAYAPASEALVGSTKYRAIYVKNTHATLTYIGAIVYVNSNTPSATTNVQISVATEVGSPVQTIVNENTAPTGQTFYDASGTGGALEIGDLAPGEKKAIWVKWVIDANTTAVNDTVTISYRGETQQ
jgi:hypothetical protein